MYLVVLEVKSQVALLALLDKVDELVQVVDLGAIDGDDRRVYDFFIADRGVVGKDMPEHHHLLLFVLGHGMHHLVQQLDRRIEIILLAVLTVWLEVFYHNKCVATNVSQQCTVHTCAGRAP